MFSFLPRDYDVYSQNKTTSKINAVTDVLLGKQNPYRMKGDLIIVKHFGEEKIKVMCKLTTTTLTCRSSVSFFEIPKSEDTDLTVHTFALRKWNQRQNK